MCDFYGQSLFVKILVKFLHTHHGSFQELQCRTVHEGWNIIWSELYYFFLQNSVMKIFS